VANHFRQVLRSACAAEAVEPWRALGVVSEEVALAVLDRCLEAEQQLDRNANQATLLECWLDDLASLFADCPQTVSS
jgi:hypothetical protein